MEYNAAQDRGIDTLVFLLSEDSPWPRKHDELDRDPEIRRWRSELSEKHGVSFFALSPESIEIQPAIARWLAGAAVRTEPKLVIQTIDFKCAQPDRKNRLLLFNGHTVPVFVERLWLMTREGSHLGPTFSINDVVGANSIREFVSPGFRNDETAGESWAFPSYEAGVIQTLDTNWARREPGWENERWENGDPVYVSAVLSYRFEEKRLLTKELVWQGFSLAIGRRWR